MNKQANKSKRQRFRQESEVRKGKDDGKLKGKAGRKEKEEIMAEKEYGKKKSTPKPVLDVSLDEDRIHITKSDLHFYANRSLPDFLNGSDLASATVNMKKCDFVLVVYLYLILEIRNVSKIMLALNFQMKS